MKINKNSTKVISTTALSIIIVALAGYTTYAFMAKTWPFYDSTTTSSVENKDNGSAATNKSSNDKTGTDTDKSSTNDQDKTPIKYSPPSDSNSSDNTSSNTGGITGTINYANVVDGTLKVRVNITQLLDSGICILTLKNTTDGTTSTYKTDIIANPSSSTCDGFNIPTKNLTKGDYNISIQLTSGDKTGVLSSKVSI